MNILRKATLGGILGSFLFLFSSCAVWGPVFVDPGVYRKSKATINQAMEADRAYYVALASSYTTQGLQVVQKERPRVPAYYQYGILINHRGRPVTFHIKGEKSAVIDVLGATKEVELPPGEYEVRLYEYGYSWSYGKGRMVIDSERGDTVVDGKVYDFSIMAP